MDRIRTLYCTLSQTRKAIELGVPIIVMNYCEADEYRFKDNTCLYREEDKIYEIPSAEQLIKWFEDQETISEVLVECICGGWTYYIFDKDFRKVSQEECYNSREEATYAAIDAALEYLTSKK